MRRIPLVIAILALAAGVSVLPRHLLSRPATSGDYVHFESAHVHPAVMTPSGKRLLVVNTPDAQLTVFDLTGIGPGVQKVAAIPVGLEPVSVACLDDSTAWVVNQLSDDISVVNLNTLHVRATLRVGDEPSDVVFAGTPTRAFVTVTGEDLIKVYTPWILTGPAAVIRSPAHRPRALARNAAGTFVYVAMFEGGNRTTVVPANRFGPGEFPSDPDFPRNPALPPNPPKVGLMVQNQLGTWSDMYGNAWNSKIHFTMPDVDLAEINTTSFTVSRTFAGLGAANFGVAVNPSNGTIGVTSTAGETRQFLRYEPRLIGYLAETQVSFITAAGVIALRKLDPHIDYTTVPGTQAEADSAIGIPTGIVFAADGSRAYVTSLATNKIGVLNPVGGTFSTLKARVKAVEGPTGIVVDDARHKLYVIGHAHNEIQTLSTLDFSELARQPIGFDPTPDAVVHGRQMFYGGFTSTHGDQSCATCHVFGDTDHLAWDLGDPTAGYVPPPNPNPNGLHGFDPEKGPMITQTLRGISGTEPFHWRGDRADIFAFNPAFTTLMGRTDPLPDSQMTALADFVAALTLPPNPNQNLDRTFPDAAPGSPSAARGKTFFESTVFDSLGHKCVDCHSGPAGTSRQIMSSAVVHTTQDFKVPQLRTTYTKMGYKDSTGVANEVGFGFGNDGTVHSLDELFTADSLHRIVTSAADRADVEAYLLAFDTGTPPAVGFQVTFDGTNNSDATTLAELDTLKGQQDAGNIQVIAKGRLAGQDRGWLYVGGDQWQPDKQAGANVTTADLIATAGLGTELTFTGVPSGSGHRMAQDQDRDGYWDGDELDAGSDPGSAVSTPLNAGVPPGTNVRAGIQSVRPNPFRGATEIAFVLARRGAVDAAIYDVLGREVRTLARHMVLDAGPRSLAWDGRRTDGAQAGAGVYFVRLRTGDGAWTRAMVRIR
ncbi:MAG TPA: hypothetical protein VFK69_03210 [Candidatus Eisenbacteria bacterium]|nr:hypothetical protein [Candidatus Eisenbacteria bacterium]